jgi:hypothetical protein
MGQPLGPVWERLSLPLRPLDLAFTVDTTPSRPMGWGTAFGMMDVQYHGDWHVTADELRERMDQSEIMKQFMRNMALWCTQIKHSGFRHEREWRAIRFTPSDSDGRQLYRHTAMGRTPYVEFDVTDPTSTPRRPLIRRIVCGPPGAEDKLNALRSLLAEFGYQDSEVEVVPSGTPFRG